MATNLGMAHAFASPLGTALGITHDTLNGVLGRTAVTFSDEAPALAADRRGARRPARVPDIVACLDSFLARAELPRTLRELGIDWDSVEQVLPHAARSSGVRSAVEPMPAWRLRGVRPRRMGGRTHDIRRGEDMDTDALIERLVQIPGPSGFEDAVALAIRDELDGVPGEVTSDALGNLVLALPASAGRAGADAHGAYGRGRRCSSSTSPTTASSTARERLHRRAHAASPGGSRSGPTHGPVLGIVGSKSRHQVDRRRSRRAPIVVEDLWIDVGARSAAEAAALGIRIGLARHDWSPLRRGWPTATSSSKAIDNRAGCAVAHPGRARGGRAPARLRAQSSPWSTQEEVGSRGARVAAQWLARRSPRWSSTPRRRVTRTRRCATRDRAGRRRARDPRPGHARRDGHALLAGGPARAGAAADAEAIPFQVDVYPTWTDACEIHLAGRGVRDRRRSSSRAAAATRRTR